MNTEDLVSSVWNWSRRTHQKLIVVGTCGERDCWVRGWGCGESTLHLLESWTVWLCYWVGQTNGCWVGQNVGLGFSVPSYGETPTSVLANPIPIWKSKTFMSVISETQLLSIGYIYFYWVINIQWPSLCAIFLGWSWGGWRAVPRWPRCMDGRLGYGLCRTSCPVCDSLSASRRDQPNERPPGESDPRGEWEDPHRHRCTQGRAAGGLAGDEPGVSGVLRTSGNQHPRLKGSLVPWEVAARGDPGCIGNRLIC